MGNERKLAAARNVYAGVWCGCWLRRRLNGSDAQRVGTLRMEPTQPSAYEMVDETNASLGFDADIAKAIADKLGMELEIINMEFDALIPGPTGSAGLFHGRHDRDTGREEQVNFTASYATGIQSIIVAEEFEIAKVEDLTGRRLAYRPVHRLTASHRTPW